VSCPAIWSRLIFGIFGSLLKPRWRPPAENMSWFTGLLRKLSASPAFVNLLHQVYEQGSGRAAPNQSLYQVLRCLKGKSGLKHAFYFHYDSYVVSALLPVIIPSQGSGGHLRYGTEPAAGQIVISLQSHRQDHSG
jgi:hypothetical protein